MMLQASHTSCGVELGLMLIEVRGALRPGASVARCLGDFVLEGFGASVRGHGARLLLIMCAGAARQRLSSVTYPRPQVFIHLCRHPHRPSP